MTFFSFWYRTFSFLLNPLQNFNVNNVVIVCQILFLCTSFPVSRKIFHFVNMLLIYNDRAFQWISCVKGSSRRRLWAKSLNIDSLLRVFREEEVLKIEISSVDSNGNLKMKFLHAITRVVEIKWQPWYPTISAIDLCGKWIFYTNTFCNLPSLIQDTSFSVRSWPFSEIPFSFLPTSFTP